MKKQTLTHDDIREVSIAALVSVVQDKLAPAAARAAASRTLLESIGAIGRLQEAGRLNERPNTSEMTASEIADEIARLSQRLPPAKLKKVM